MTTSLIVCTPGGDSDNCYVTTAQANTYFTNTLRWAAWEGWSSTQREQALIQATREIEQMGGEWVMPSPTTAWSPHVSSYGRSRFVGAPVTYTQALHFPRLGDYTSAGVKEVPRNIRDACCEQAYYLLQMQDGPELLPRADLQAQGVKSVAIDGLSETYGPRNVPEGIAPKAWPLLKPYVRGAWETC